MVLNNNRFPKVAGFFFLLIKKNQTIRGVAIELKKDGIYKNRFISFALMRFLIGNNGLNFGEYEALKGDSILTLIKKIKNKDYYYRRITFIEGETINTYENQIKNATGLTSEIKYKVDEGYFMAGTYFYLYGENANNILKRSHDDMMAFISNEFEKIENKEEFYLKNIHEVLTLASVVEKETGVDGERGLIAGVFYNRLQKKMRLQSDPTTVYEITRGKFQLNRPLTYKDLEIVGDYNTYRKDGLPSNPIASPSRQSVLAVLNPVKTDYIFFVADGKGGHTFSKTFEEHKEQVKLYRNILNKKNDTNPAGSY